MTPIKKLAAAVAVAIGTVGSAQAVLITSPNSTFNADSIDWTVTSFLADGGITAVQNYLANQQTGSQLDTSFNVYTHAKMVTYNDGALSGLSPLGINSNWEITIVASFTEVVNGVFPLGVSTASFTGQASTGFFQMYLDTNPNANDLAGTGFNDGKLIAVGSLANDPLGSYTVTNITSVLLDQYNGDSWGGQQTVSGGGSSINPLQFSISAFDSSVFTGGLQSLLLSFSNVSIALPFQEVDPSKCFSPDEGRTSADVGTSFGSTTCADGGNGILPSLGRVNGVNGPDFLAQTDYNSSLVGERIPEPASMALLGAGLAALGVASRRRKAQ